VEQVRQAARHLMGVIGDDPWAAGVQCPPVTEGTKLLAGLSVHGGRAKLDVCEFFFQSGDPIPYKYDFWWVWLTEEPTRP
jgi:hypothetical protein